MTVTDERMPGSRSDRAHGRAARRRSRRGIWIALGILVLVAGVATGTYLLTRDDGNDSGSAASALADGLQLVIQNKPGAAAVKFQEVLRSDPNNKLALYNLALIEQQANDTALAEQHYRRVLVVDPAYAPALYNLGIIVADSGNSSEAISLYQRATAADPNFAKAWLNLGLLLHSTGNAQGGAVALTKAVQLDPSLASRIPENERPAA
jgi:Tfp pilus assembly protein PilF